LGMLFVVLLLASLFFLRQNNLHMITFRNLAIRADEQNKNIPLALTNLRDYIAGHMNTGMGEDGIYLEYSYQRAYEGTIQQASQNGTDSAVIYQNADKACRAQFDMATSFSAYIKCVADKVAASGAPKVPNIPSADLYRFNFISPAWSPDLAGFTLLAAVLAALLLVGRVVLQGIMYALYQANR
jgi:hypothetical protein